MQTLYVKQTPPSPAPPQKNPQPHKTKRNQFHHRHETSTFTLRSSTTVSANPTTYMATATAFAKAKISPIDPPNSGPRLLEIRQYAPPADRNDCYFSTTKHSAFAFFSPHITVTAEICAFDLTNIIILCPILIGDTAEKQCALYWFCLQTFQYAFLFQKSFQCILVCKSGSRYNFS